MDELGPGRRHPAHHPSVERHNEPVIIFLTVCSKDRKRMFASTDVVRVLENAWRQAKTWLVDRYVIMPDHIHLFCAPATIPPESLEQWVHYWKNIASKNWVRPNEHPIWQRDFWDIQLRRHENTMRMGLRPRKPSPRGLGWQIRGLAVPWRTKRSRMVIPVRDRTSNGTRQRVSLHQKLPRRDSFGQIDVETLFDFVGAES
jgi:REP element-mobilizing transposase RayT